MTPRKPASPVSPDKKKIEVGSFFLETLTTGMYENPFHSIREYVQNSFDAIQDSIRAGILPDSEGRILISAEGTQRSPSLSIRDNGTGIVESKAVSTLISLGASRKTPSRHAGFRGIGRLAGIAYCTTLRFTTSAQGELTATVVEFDCGMIRSYFSPGAEPADIRDVISSTTKTSVLPAKEEEHFTQVDMVGLVNLGVEFADFQVLEPYLREVSPVEYLDSFSYADRIRRFVESFGDELPTVHVETKQKRERKAIHKSYKNHYPAGKGVSKLHDIEPVSSKENGWFGWIGVSNFPGEISDGTVAGIRFRSRNIQIGGMSIIQRLAEETTASGSDRRLMTYAVGEIFVTNPQVVPNARRDGFEDSEAWRIIRKELKSVVVKRVVKLVRAASGTRSAIKRISDAIDQLTKRADVEEFTEEEKTEIEATIRERLKELASPTKLVGADPKDVSRLTSNLKELAETVAKIPVAAAKTQSTEDDDDAVGTDTEGENEDDNQTPSSGNGDSPDGENDGSSGDKATPHEIVFGILREELPDELATKLAHKIVEALKSP
ncbi:ATP-binding protein [uncultured Roseobacter sp.]|uniref:ATP-binding protein n=1 Tax=uncultured Roseobacter sp. TaxID=114847 RepID=UPI002621B525|nr:ATP-binding protein [uncultured Roseobacter sp.]